MLMQRLRMAAQQLIGTRNPGNAGESAPPVSAAIFEDVALMYIATKEPNWGAHADATAKCVIRKHLIGHLGQRRVDELTAAKIQLFFHGMVRNDASQSLLRKAVLHLRAILELAQELGIIVRNPMRNSAVKFDYQSRKQKSERCLTLEECRALLSELGGRDHLIVRMFIQLGLRPEELFALRRNDVNHEFIRIDEVFTKGQIRETPPWRPAVHVYVPPDLMRELLAWTLSTCGNDNDFLFPTPRPRRAAVLLPMGQNGFRNGVLKPAGERAGIADIDLLALRRTCATHFGHQASARDTQAQMRLSSPLTALTHTPQPLPESLKRVAVIIEAEVFGSTTNAFTPLPG